MTGTVADKLERRAALLDKAVDKVGYAAARLSQKAEQIEEFQRQLATLDLWTRPEPGSRKPRFTRDDIAAAAVVIADTEGFDALSMRRLAQALGAGTMTLYHYVRTKDELLALVNDTVMGEVIVPDGQLPDTWRRAVTAIARRSRASILRHPWVLDLRFEGSPGPNAVRHFDQSVAAVSTLDAPMELRLELIGAVDEYVFGHCQFERAAAPSGDQAGMTRYVDTLIDGGGYPALAELRATFGGTGAWRLIDRVYSDPSRFDRNLDRLLDGFEGQLARR